MGQGNFKLYNASAGSGKTFTLKKEFLLLALSSDIPSYKNILAVTFTNKAANEMKIKILNKLKGIMNDTDDASSMKQILTDTLHVDEETLKKRASQLYVNVLHNYSDFSVSTIDAFVQKISRNFAKELNLPNQYKVMLDDDDLLDELIQRIDKKIHKDDELLTKVLSQYIKYQINEEDSWHIDSMLRKFISKLFKETAYKKKEISTITPVNESQYQETEKYLNDKIVNLKNSIYNNIKSIEDFNTSHYIDFDTHYNKVLPSLLNKIKKDINIVPENLTNKTIKEILECDKNWYKGKKHPDITEKEKINLLKLFSDIIENHKLLYVINIIQKNLYLYVLKGTLLNIINEFIEDTNKVHISEFNKRLSDVIDGCSVPFIYERIGEKYKHFFIDEFQDTSLLQWFNFLPLINNSLSENKMNLLVGDAKQAIYRFRSGEVEQIIKLPEIHKNPGTVVSRECEAKFKDEISKNYLDTNRRSKKNIVAFNNSFFRKTRENLENIAYRSVYQDKMEQRYMNSEYEGFVNVEIFDLKRLSEMENSISDEKHKTSKTLYRDAVKKSILKDVNDLVSKGFNYSDITILVRNNSDGSDIAQFLTNNGVRVISSDSILLKSSDKVQLIIHSLKFMMNEDNEVIRLSLSYYQELCKNNDDADKLSSALNYEIESVKLKELRNKAFGLYDMCSMIIKMYGFSVVDDVFLHYFMGVVHDWQNSENGDISDFIEYWDKKSDSLSVKSASKENAVEIMTIHKSKGLDFKVVMYPYAYTKVPDRFKGGEKWLSFKNDFEELKDIPYIDDFILPISSSLVETKMETHYEEEYQKAAFDDFNIMYVATTRPKEALYIYTENTVSKTNPVNFFVDYFNETENHYYAEYDCEDKEILRESFSYDKIETEVSEVYSIGEIIYNSKKEDINVNELCLAKDDSVETIDWQNVLKFDADPTMFLAESDMEYTPKEWGNIVHDILSEINTLEDAPKILERHLNYGSIDDAKAATLMRQFEKVTAIPEITNAYSSDAIVKNEMDILTKDGKILRPDRYVELPDKEMIIDYKTGKPNEKYYSQLQNYMIALREMGVDKNIEAYIVYLGENIDVQRVYLDRLF